MERDGDAKESTICHSTGSLPPAQDRLLGRGGCSTAGHGTWGCWLWPAPSPYADKHMELEVLAGERAHRSSSDAKSYTSHCTQLSMAPCPKGDSKGGWMAGTKGHLCCSVARRTALSPSNLCSVSLSSSLLTAHQQRKSVSFHSVLWHCLVSYPLSNLPQRYDSTERPTVGEITLV